MNFKKAISFLRRLADSEAYDLDTYSKVHALLAGFYNESQDENGSIIDSALAEKIDDVEMYFQVLCGFGTDEFTEEAARKNLLSSIDKLDMIVSDKGLGLSSQR
ncbi:MAG TPA: hypothetical protein VMW78_00745 [Anaerolineae bacterium]|nr:hypothetical protein [Anaerolineae bacterium]